MRPFLKTVNYNDPNPAYYPMQESRSVPGSTVKAALGIAGTTTTTTADPESPTRWQCQTRDGNIEWCKGIRVKSSTTGGNLVVHLAENPADENDTYDIPAGSNVTVYKEGMIFDYVLASGTTIDLDDVTFLL